MPALVLASLVTVRIISAVFSTLRHLTRLTADVQSTINTSHQAQSAAFPLTRPEQAQTPPCTLLYQLQDQNVGEGAFAGLRELAEICGEQAYYVPTSISGTARPDAHRDTGGAENTAQDCHLDDITSVHYQQGFCDEGDRDADPTRTKNKLLCPPRTHRSDSPVLLPCAPKSLPYGSNISVKAGHESSSRLQQQLLTAGATSSSSEIGFNDSRSDLDMTCNSFLPDTPKTMVDREPPTGRVGTADSGQDESDGPSLPGRRHRKRQQMESSYRTLLTASRRSSESSSEVESTKVLRGRKRLRRRKVLQRDPSISDPDHPLPSPAASTSSANIRDRWSVHCVIVQKMVGPQEVITIELPAFAWCTLFDGERTSLPLSNTVRTTPTPAAQLQGKCRVRFSKAEEDLLAELKEQRDPKLSWKQIQRRFPTRTKASLQVHYCTQLNNLSKRCAAKPS